MFDLDSKGRMTKNELNFYSMISSSEELTDEDWNLVQGLVEARKGEMTREQFIRLHEIEAESGEFNTDDMFQRLFNLGFNKSLEIDHVKFFLL